MSLFQELRRRNVFKVGIAYLVGAWLLVQVADILLDTIGAPTWVLQALLVALGVGFFITLFFAWAYELTPEGVKREKDVDRNQSITSQTGKKLNNAILVLMALAIGYLLYDKFFVQGPEMGSEPFSQESAEQVVEVSDEKRDPTPVETEPASNRQSIAVLPFDNRSNREEDQFFTDGIHDDLLTTIAQIGSMKVISRTSVMEYKDTTKKIPVIAAELGVANILEGGIQRSGNQVRINVQLIDAKTDEHLWAQIFDRELTAENLFTIQSEISKAVADALHAKMLPEEERRIDAMPTDNLAAYDAYLRGRQLMASRDSAKLKLSIEEFNKAVELDPEFALAWVGIADSTALFAIYGTLTRQAALPIRENALGRALAIDGALGEAYTSLGALHSQRSQLDEAEAAYKRAIELSPNYATAWHWYSEFLTGFPLRVDEAINFARKAIELDPRSSIIGLNLADAYSSRGAYLMAERQTQKVIDLDPGFAGAYANLTELYTYQTSRYVEALELALKAYELDPGNISRQITIVDIYLELGDMAAVQAVRDRMADLDADHPDVGFADLLIGAVNQNPEAFREAFNWLLPKIKHNLWEVRWMGWFALIQGDKERSRELYLTANPGWLQPDQWQFLIERFPMESCVVSWLFLHTGDPDLGSALLRQTTALQDEELPNAIEHADIFRPEICYLSAGETEKALQAIETQMAHNHLFDWPISHQLPMYDLIRHEPRYQAALAERERRIAVQREAIAEMETGAGS